MTNRKQYFIHDNAIVETVDIGEDTRIWAFCNVQKGARIGASCNICDHSFVENNVVIGDGVTVKNGVSLWDGVVIEDRVFIGPNAVFTNDIRPRSRVSKPQFDRTLVKEGATIGANATIVAGHTIGRYAFIGAGAVVTSDVPDFEVWFGNPARHQGYVCKCAERFEFATGGEEVILATCSCGLQYRLVDGTVQLVASGG
ncbi:MAG: N-acetyltransferase [candidate division Zixibacteria bacterium]|nr:N-acetyltransferase [candidate division Zixibacteria bacterium]